MINNLLEETKDIEFHEPEYFSELTETKEIILRILQEPVDKLVDWWLCKKQALNLLYELGFKQYENEPIMEDIKINRPPFIERRELKLDRLLSLDLPEAIIRRLKLLKKASLPLTKEESMWYQKEIMRWIQLS